MKKIRRFTDSDWRYGSYARKEYKKDMLYTFYQYKVFLAVYNMALKTVVVSDQLAEQMRQDGLIDTGTCQQYRKQAHDLFVPIDRHDEQSIEQIYDEIQQLRIRVMGAEALEQEQDMQAKHPLIFDARDGIDQSRKKKELLASCDTIFFVLCQADLFSLMGQDIREARQAGKKICVIANEEPGYDLPSVRHLHRWMEGEEDISFLPIRTACGNGIQRKERLPKESNHGGEEKSLFLTEGEKACLMFYGEEGFLHCRNLNLEAVIHGIPSGYYTKALTNQFGKESACIVYVPEHFDITRWVRLTERTRLSYWQLARLWEAYGDEIYAYSPQELYRRYPQYFINIYENGENCPEAAPDYPIRIQWNGCEKGQREWRQKNEGEDLAVFARYDSLRDQSIRQYVNEKCHYISTYFDLDLIETPIPWYGQGQQNGILVQGIRASGVRDSRVIFCKENRTLRQMLSEEDSLSFKIFSNFLFFLTPKLARLYNDLRGERPREQIDVQKGHLDYMLFYKEGKRIETFPLFRKSCIAMKQDGQFLIFNHRLGGGRMEIAGQSLSWTAADVDVRAADEQERNGQTAETQEKEGKIRIYTPYYSCPEEGEPMGTYRCLVGEDAVNLVILQDRIQCIRKGTVVLPAIGVVVSLSGDLGKRFLETAGLRPLEDGYYDCEGLSMTLKLESPAGIPPQEWEQVAWAYGGGLSLIIDGVGLGDKGDTTEWFREEGWMSPLSRQTQESELHTMVKHPRTAIGITKNGELVILVFSGRTWLSTGADYRGMCEIARKIIPDIWCLMNVDGGGSAVLGMSIGSSFMELSYPATSIGSCAGMVRPVNTVLCLEI